MSPRERFLTALHCDPPDRVPIYEHLFSLKLMQELLGFTTTLYEGEAQSKLAAELGIDMIWAPINGFCGIEEAPHRTNEIYLDEWGVTYKKNGWPIIAQIDTPVKTRDDWTKYKLPEAAASNRVKIIKDASKANDSDLAIVAGLLGPFTMKTWYLMDLENFSMNMFMDPDLIHEVNNAFIDWSLETARLVVDEADIDAFQISDDWGGTTSLLISPEHFREFFTQPFARLVGGLKALDKPVIMHNDGQIWDVLDDLVDTGISGFHPVERAAGMDLRKVKERYSNRLCPIGNVNNKSTMVSGSPRDVADEVMECLKIAARGGGYIIATDHSLHDDIPIENVYSFIETVKKHGVYPM